MQILIVGTVRNCEKTINDSIKYLDNAFKFVSKIEYLIIESDSQDKTIEYLNLIKNSKKNFNFKSFGKLRNTIPERTKRIAFCRNEYLKYLRSEKYSKVQYLVVADFDGVINEINESNVKSSFKNLEWDVCTANCSDYYYDIYALRHPYWSPNDCMIAAKENERLGLKKSQSIFYSVYSRMIKLNKYLSFIEVDSAFGGLAIYKISSIPKNAKYIGVDKNNNQTCEHVLFHQFIKNSGGKIFINPQMIIGKAPYEHVRYKKHFGKIIFYFKTDIIYLLEKNPLMKLVLWNIRKIIRK